MAQYQVWILDSNGAKQALVPHFLRLEYTVAVNMLAYAHLDMAVDDPAVIPALQDRARLVIIRRGEIIFGGEIEAQRPTMPESAPQGEVVRVTALDWGKYARDRLIIPPSGQSHDERSGHADDVAKAYVRAHLAEDAGSRSVSAISTDADLGQADTVDWSARYAELATVIRNLAAGRFYWRFVPTWAGATFTTRAPLWGVDRTLGNGVNVEAVFSLDRHSVRSVKYTLDLSQHYNRALVGGQGQGADRTIVTVDRTDWQSRFGLREHFVDARHLSNTASLQEYGLSWLAKHAPKESVEFLPMPGTWKASEGTTWDVGDKVTVIVRHWGGEVKRVDGIITRLKVTVAPESLEEIVPTLEVVS